MREMSQNIQRSVEISNQVKDELERRKKNIPSRKKRAVSLDELSRELLWGLK
jgi:hypothetical protein